MLTLVTFTILRKAKITMLMVQLIIYRIGEAERKKEMLNAQIKEILLTIDSKE